MNKQSFEFKKRTTLKLIKSHNADGLLLVSPVNRFWYTGVKTEFGMCLITKKCSSLFVDSRDCEHCKKTLPFITVYKYEQLNDVSKYIKANKLKKIVVEKEFITLAMLENLIDPLHIRPIPTETTSLRLIKTEEEIKLLQESANIACKAMDYIRSWIKEGVSELETAKEISEKMLDLGASGNSFELIVAFGENSAVPHHHPTNRKLKTSEFIKIDIGCVYRGYCSDITRTFWLGKPTKKMLEIYQIVLEANKLGIKQAKKDVVGSELDAFCREYIDDTRYFGRFVHGTGHGLGIEIHELPNVKANYNLPLPNNSVITIEPGIYVPGFGGVRIEDSIVIRNNKPLVLTTKCKK